MVHGLWYNQNVEETTANAAGDLKEGGQYDDNAVQHMKDAGYANVTAKMYPGMRHEILNHAEPERQAVYDDLLAIFDSWTE